MSQNITLDDTDSQLIYTGWASQSPSDPNLSRFIGDTYHVAQKNGATMNFTVQGAGGIYIYGSKGPKHVSDLASPY